MKHIESRTPNISERWKRLMLQYSLEKKIEVRPTELMTSLSYVNRYLNEVRPSVPELVDGKIMDMKNILLWAVGARICSPITASPLLKPGVDFNNWLSEPVTK